MASSEASTAIVRNPPASSIARVSGAGIHLPNPSYWPILAALGVGSVFVSIMLVHTLGPIAIAAAVLFFFFCVFKWAFEPAG